MKKAEKNKKGEIYHSMDEIERRLFPRSAEKKRLSQMEEDPHAFGVNLATQSLEKIAHQLARQ